MHSGLVILLAGMFIALFLSVRLWDKSPVYRYLPPAYGLVAGIAFAILWQTPNTSLILFLETVAAFTAAGWGFWFAIWVEKRGQDSS